MTTTTTTPLPLGQLLATPAALQTMREANINPAQLLRRHAHGDWGDLHADDALANERAIRTGMRVLSAYAIRPGEFIWILTEADRTVTTILTPSDY